MSTRASTTTLSKTFSIEQLLSLALNRISSIAHYAGDRRVVPHDLIEDTQALLESLPFDQMQFAVATLRLDNAIRYFDDEEWGAATYEIRLLKRAISGMLDVY